MREAGTDRVAGSAAPFLLSQLVSRVRENSARYGQCSALGLAHRARA